MFASLAEEANRPWLLVPAALWLLVLTFYPRWRRKVLKISAHPDDEDPFWGKESEGASRSPWVRGFLFAERCRATHLLELVVSLSLIAASGGWTSPFYEFSLSSVISPALTDGSRVAAAATVLYSVGYWLIVFNTGQRSADLHNSGGLLPSVVATAMIPIVVAGFSALLGKVIARLRQEQREVRRLAQVEERYRIARELHDGVAQTLFMLTLSLEGAQRRAAQGQDGKLAGRLQELLEVSRQALRQTRSTMLDPDLILDAHTPFLDALHRMIREYQTLSHQKVDFVCRGECPDLESRQRLAIYRIVQEGLANACRHSGGDSIQVTLDCSETQIVIEVEDNGKGFDPENVEKGHGLDNLVARSQEIGGQVSWTAAPQKGTIFRFVL